MTSGPRVGMSYMLDPRRRNLMGRGVDCSIVLGDELCSRVHAILTCRDKTWWIVDDHSRNGTYVNDTKIDEAALAEGNRVRIGATEFVFHQSNQPPTVDSATYENLTQTVIQDCIIAPEELGPQAVDLLRESAYAQDVLLLYQLSLKLLQCSDPHEVIRHSLGLLHERVQASLAGFLWMDDEGRLKPQLVVPEEAADGFDLSETLTHLVCEQRRAVWIANQRSARSESDNLEHFADALCVPLLHNREIVGAIHAYLEEDHFRQSDFDFAISLANVTTAALVRARHEISLQSSYERLKRDSPGYDELVGESKPMLELKAKIDRLARASGCVLVRGESGAGKELVARALHRRSPRADRPMISVNCAAIPADLMESQLFGHRAGSFTGADRDHEGFFQQADLGTLFLDEIGELPLGGQAKLLRILEGHPFLPVGSTQEVKVDVRVIAATNRDLLSYVREKQFREDLYYRLSVFELVIPPLRERGEDIRRLIEFFFDHYRRQHGRPHLKFSEAALNKLLSYHWPGNVRQLRNVLDSTVVLADGDEIEPNDLGLRDSGGGELKSLKIADWEHKLIIEALGQTGNNVPEAAKLLGIGRATLYRKIDEYGIER